MVSLSHRPGISGVHMGGMVNTVGAAVHCVMSSASCHLCTQLLAQRWKIGLQIVKKESETG